MSGRLDQREAALRTHSTSIARPPHDASRLRARVLAMAEHGHAIDDDVLHTDGVLLRRVEGGLVRNCCWIEDNDVRKAVHIEATAVLQLPVVAGSRVMRRMASSSGISFSSREYLPAGARNCHRRAGACSTS